MNRLGANKAAPALKLYGFARFRHREYFAVFQTYVQPEGHRVSRARNGVEAVEMAKTGESGHLAGDGRKHAGHGRLHRDASHS